MQSFQCYIFILTFICISACPVDIWEKVPCDADFTPENCDLEKKDSLTVEDFERCGTAKLSIDARKFYLAASGRRITYNANKQAYQRIRIVPKMLRDVSERSLEISTLHQKLALPIGLSPVEGHKLAHPLGEIATVRGIKHMGTVMILSSLSTTSIEEVAAEARGGSSHLWMQTYVFKNRTYTVDIVRRAEKAGYRAIVVTVDSPKQGSLTCNARAVDKEDIDNVNVGGNNVGNSSPDPSFTFKDLTWLKTITNLPIIAKGFLSASDAVRAVRAGAGAILVSNHGGRQMDSAPATIEVLPDIVDAVKNVSPGTDVYVDGGIRNGWDVYKAIASGAKMAFVGRPQIFGLAEGGEDGVNKVISILRKEFEEVMMLAGASNPSEISRDTLVKSFDTCCP